MKHAAIGLAVSITLVACSGSGASSSPTPSTASPPPVGTPTPSASGQGFCVDRSIIGDVYHQLRAGRVPYRQAAAAVAAAGKVMRADVDLVPPGEGARTLRRFVLYLNTLRLAILGAVENYPDDFAVGQFTKGLVDNVGNLVVLLDCPLS